MRRRTLLAFLPVAILCTLGCSGASGSSDTDAHEGEQPTGEARDAGGTRDAPADSGKGQDAQIPLDSGYADAGTPPFDPRDYVCAAGETTRFYPGSSAPFVEPKTGGLGPKTRQQILSDFGGTLPERLRFLSADRRLDPGPGPIRALFVRPGEDITLYTAFASRRSDVIGTSLMTTVMVDYEPVEAHYLVWNDERALPRSASRGTGFSTEIDRDVTLVDITIPASAFPDERRYELGLFQMDSGELMSSFNRIAVYVGGFEGATHPCTPARDPVAPLTELERELKNHVPFAMAYPTSAPDTDAVLSPIEVEGGEEVDITLTLWATRGDVANEVWVPLIDGKPVGEPWWVSRRDVPNHEASARHRMRVAMPVEKGRYHFAFAGFADPFVPPADHHGTPVEGVRGSGAWAGTNVLTFDVVK